MIWLMIGLAWGGFLVGFVVGVWWRSRGADRMCDAIEAAVLEMHDG